MVPWVCSERRHGNGVGMTSPLPPITLYGAADAERHFGLLVESVQDYAIFILDPCGVVTTWNTGARRIKGYVAHEIIGRHFSVFYPPEAVAAGRCEEELAIAARHGRFEDEGWRVRQDGGRLWANVVITALRDRDGELVGFSKVTRDLTDRMEAEANMRVLLTQKTILEERMRVQEFQERFVAILGHDLRNPLAAIIMGSAVLQQQASDPLTLRVLNRMIRSSRRMARMIDQILDLTRSRLAGGLVMNMAPMDLQTTLLGIVEELRTAHPSRSVNLYCLPLLGSWDRDRLEQVFSNLVSNAILHGDPGSQVTVTAEENGNHIRVSVHNQGLPIPEDVRLRLFDPFRRGERDSRTSRTAGLGLGLYITQEVVRAHGGYIDVQSTRDEGTTFSINLPSSVPSA
jgi:PAS domain S-box-containing protein